MMWIASPTKRREGMHGSDTRAGRREVSMHDARARLLYSYEMEM